MNKPGYRIIKQVENISGKLLVPCTFSSVVGIWFLYNCEIIYFLASLIELCEFIRKIIRITRGRLDYKPCTGIG